MAKALTFPAKRAEAMLARPRVKREFVPLFDHLINLADDDYKGAQSATSPGVKRMRSLRAGRSLKTALDLIRKYGER